MAAATAVPRHTPERPPPLPHTGFRSTTPSRRDVDYGTTAGWRPALVYLSADRRTSRSAGASAPAPEPRRRPHRAATMTRPSALDEG
jgi:hypothetical protein